LDSAPFATVSKLNTGYDNRKIKGCTQVRASSSTFFIEMFKEGWGFKSPYSLLLKRQFIELIKDFFNGHRNNCYCMQSYALAPFSPKLPISADFCRLEKEMPLGFRKNGFHFYPFKAFFLPSLYFIP